MMSEEEVLNNCYDAICRQLGANREDLTNDTTIEGDLNADSLDVVELCMELEVVFDVTIPDEEWDKVTTVGSVIDIVKQEMKKQHGS